MADQKINESSNSSEIDSALEANLNASVAAPSKEPEAAKATPPDTPKVDDTAATKAEDAPAKAETDTADDSGDTLYAGKYKTSDELEKGVLELADKLDVSPFLLDNLIEQAKAKNDFAKVEQIYKDFESRIGRRAEAERTKAEQARAEKEAQASKVSESEKIVQEQKWTAYKDEETFARLANDRDLLDRFAQAGLKLPETAEEIKDLRTTDRYLYDKYVEKVRSIRDNLDNTRKEIEETTKTAGTLRSSERSSAMDTIKAFNTAKNLGLSEAEIASSLDKVIADNADILFEKKHGVDVMRKGVLAKLWYADELPKAMDKAILNATSKGRTEHADNLKKLREKTAEAGTTSSGGGKTIQRKGQIDLTDEATVKGLPYDELGENIQKTLEKQMGR